MDDIKTDAPLQSDQTENKGELKKDPSDALTPDHPRFKEVVQEKNQLKTELEDLKTELQSLRESISTRQERTGDDDLTDEEVASLEKIDRQLKKRGYVTQDQLQEKDRVASRAVQLERLAEKYDGKNGYPKFIREDVITHAKRYGFEDNLSAAYRDLHFDAIVGVEAKRQTNTPPSSERPTGSDHEVSGELTPAKIAAMGSQEWAENEDEIMRSFKRSITGK